MRERGGSTPQSGFLYQNSVAALHLGRMCDSTARPDSQLVIRVRVEAPQEVDDVVVTFADNHRAFIQAKEAIRFDHPSWVTLWKDFTAQYLREDFQRTKDRLLLWIGDARDEQYDVQSLCVRAGTSDDYAEWLRRLTVSQRRILEKIKPLLPLELLTETNLLAFFKHIDVEIYPLLVIERDMSPLWMSQSDQLAVGLFRTLRDMVGGEARRRGSFTAETLRAKLADEKIYLTVSPDIDTLRASIRQSGARLRLHKGTIGATEYRVPRVVVGEILGWIKEAFDDKPVAMLLDQAGMGKTTVMRDVLLQLEKLDIPTLAIKADQQLSGITTHNDLQTMLHLPDTVERVIGRLAKMMPVVVIIDQVDALSLSLARDQKALNVVVDLVARLCLIPGVRILLSCRTFDRNNDPNLKRIEIGRQFPLSEFTEQEVTDCLNELGIQFDTLLAPVQKLLRTPLHLDLFARAVEEQTQSEKQAATHGLASLQDLYALLWRNIVLKNEPDSPPYAEREQVIRLLSERMNRDQRTSVPQSIFTTPEHQHLHHAVQWLASAGILIEGNGEWNLLHQTFFDYCYAKQFVENGGSLTETVLKSEQGLFARPKIVQILAYLRGSNTSTYLRELQSLLRANTLRYHLQDLTLRWFGAISNPTDNEWVIAQRIMTRPTMRPKVLQAISGNLGWFQHLRDKLLLELLSKDDQVIDSEVLPYLISMLETAQDEVINVIKPYVGKSRQWNQRVAWVITRIRTWRSKEATALFERLCLLSPDFQRNQLYTLSAFALFDPETYCRLTRLMLDKIFGQFLAKRKEKLEQQGENVSYSFAFVHLPNELEALRHGMYEQTLQAVAQNCPLIFLDALLPWLERVVEFTPEPDPRWFFYGSDELSSGWYERVFDVQHELIQSLITSLTVLAQTDSGKFRRIARRLAELPYQTTQQLLTHVYRAVPEAYAEDILQFLLADQRRLNLGDFQQYDSRQLVKAVYPFLSLEQRIRLESHILGYAPIFKQWGIRALNERGEEQLFLLQEIPAEYLTEQGTRALRELERKFNGRRASAGPITSRGGMVGSPISEGASRKMSDNAWLRAMNKYHGGVTHRDFLKGGATELSRVLQSLVKEQPDRFYRLLQRVPDSVDDSYVQAFLNGIAESTVPADWLFTMVRRFAPQPGRDIRRTIAWALEKRVGEGLPNDLTSLLKSYVEDNATTDLIGGNTDLYTQYINTDSGSALRTLIRALDQQASEDARNLKWSLIETVVTYASAPLRAGAIEVLLYLLSSDRERALSLFEKLMDGYPALLRSHFTQEFIYHGMYKYFSRVKPFIQALLHDDNEQCQQRGAELVCIAYLSADALHLGNTLDSVQEWTQEIIAGPATWRRGAARVYSHNIADNVTPVCAQELEKLFNDEDEQVRRMVSNVFRFLQSGHIDTLRDFIETYATSQSFHTENYQFAEFIWKHCLLDPMWTLALVEIVLQNEQSAQEAPWSRSGEDIVKVALRVYTDPTAGDIQKGKAMDVFDKLMERYSGEVRTVLSEWDTR